MYRRFRMPSSWREMDRLQRQMNQLFDVYADPQRRPAAGFPAVNIWSNGDQAQLTAELPGVKSEDLDISIVGDTLTLTGERRFEQPEGEVRFHRQERGYGKFTRSIQLPFQVESGQVEASFDKGILHVALPRAEADKPRKITVKNAG